MLDVVSLATPLALAAGAYASLSWAFGAFFTHPWELPGVALRAGWSLVRALGLYVARGCKPRFPEWTLAFELAQSLLHELLSHYADRVTRRENAQFLRRQSELAGNLAGRLAHAQNETMATAFVFNGLEHVWIQSTAKSPIPRRRVVVLYFHGSGYVILSPRMYQPFASDLQARLQRALRQQLSEDVQVDVLLANYRKAPEHPYPQAPLDALAMYMYLLDEEKLSPRQIMIMGDSAGAGLTMTTLLRTRDQDPSLLPLAAVLACPFVDREVKCDERLSPHCLLSDRIAKAFDRAYYRGDNTPASWGDASPYHCDLHGLPPAYIQVGELDYLLPHSKRLYDKARKSGLDHWTLEIFPHMPHAFPLAAPLLPSAVAGIEVIAQYAASQFVTSLKE